MGVYRFFISPIRCTKVFKSIDRLIRHKALFRRDNYCNGTLAVLLYSEKRIFLYAVTDVNSDRSKANSMVSGLVSGLMIPYVKLLNKYIKNSCQNPF